MENWRSDAEVIQATNGHLRGFHGDFMLLRRLEGGK